MPRPLRLQIPGGIYHVTSRGNRRSAIYRDDHDNVLFLSLLIRTLEVCEWDLHAWCLMTTHFHLLITTRVPTIAAGMQKLNSRYAEAFNARYGLTGHLFEGRYKHVLVQTESHLLKAYRYIALNPVRAGACDRPDEWPWSSYTGLMRRADGVLYDERTLLRHFDGDDRRRALRRLIETGVAAELARRAGHVRGLTPDMALLGAPAPRS